MPLLLDVIRHGDALSAGYEGDAARPLSPAGRAAVSRLAQEYRDRGSRPERVFASLLLRARETALLIASGITPSPAVETLAELVPESTPERVFDALRANGAAEGHVALVGHQPLLGRLVARLSGAELSMPSGTLVRISLKDHISPGAGTVELEWRP